MAPALMSGLSGRPVVASRLIALNGSPLGSNADVALDDVDAELADRQGVHERLRARLDRERQLVVAGRVHVAAHAGEGDAEAIRVDRGELGDVVRHGAVGRRRVLGQDVVEAPFDHVHGRQHAIGFRLRVGTTGVANRCILRACPSGDRRSATGRRLDPRSCTRARPRRRCRARRCARHLRDQRRPGQGDDVPVAVPPGATRPVGLPDRRRRRGRVERRGAARARRARRSSDRRGARRRGVRPIRRPVVVRVRRLHRRRDVPAGGHGDGRRRDAGVLPGDPTVLFGTVVTGLARPG